MLWWANRVLHIFGWAIVLHVEGDGKVNEAYPARTRWRGFSEETEAEGFLKVTKYMAENASALQEEVKD